MSGSASIVWALPFTSRVIRAMGAYLPGDAARQPTCDRSRVYPRSAVVAAQVGQGRLGPRIGRCASLAIANGSRLAKLVQGAGIGNSLTQLCCEGVPAPAAQELAAGPTPNRRPTRAPTPSSRAPAFPKCRG